MLIDRGGARFLQLGGPGRVAADHEWDVGRWEGCSPSHLGWGLGKKLWTFAFKMVHFGAF